MMAGMHEIEPAYRAPMAARSGERQGRRVLLIGAAAAIGVFAAVLGLRELFVGARGPHEVPVIAADTRPTRVRPSDPGGLTVPDQDKLIFEREATRTATSQQAVLAPPPEAPRPVPRNPVPPRIASQPAPSASPPPATTPSASAAPAAAQPAAARLPAPTPAVTPATAAPVRGGRIAVQLAALGSRDEAMAEWERLKRRAPDVFGSRRPQVVPLERDGKTFYRLRTDGFADPAAARGFCEQVRARGLSCFVPSA